MTAGAVGEKIPIVRKVERPRGRRTNIPDNADAATRRSLRKENESADILAREGYDVEQNPVVSEPKNPDYRINGNIYDNYAPETSSARNIWATVEDKVLKEQADNIVLNLTDSPVDLKKLSKQFSD